MTNENTNTKNVAGPSLRLLSYLVDLSLWTTAPVIFIHLSSRAGSLDTLLSSLLSFFIFMISWAPLIYPLIQIVSISKLRGTLGKLLCGLEIVNKNGKKLSFKYAFFRNYIGYTVSGLLFNLGFIWILVDKERRGWHDQIAGSWVVVKRKSFALVGSASLLLLLALNIYLGNSIYKNIIKNSSLYQNIYQDAYTEIQNLIESVESENEEVDLKNFDFESVEDADDLKELELQLKELERKMENNMENDLEDTNYEASPQTEIS